MCIHWSCVHGRKQDFLGESSRLTAIFRWTEGVGLNLERLIRFLRIRVGLGSTLSIAAYAYDCVAVPVAVLKSVIK